MAMTIIPSEKLTLYADPAAHRYAVRLPNGDVWTISDEPYVRFADGRRAAFPPPASEEAYHTGVSDGVRAVYTGFEGTEIAVYTHVYVEHTGGDVYFEMRTENDERCEIAEVSFPGPVDFGAAPGRGYTVLPRMQGTMFPAGEPIRCGEGTVFERDAYMPMYGQVRNAGGYLAVFDTPYDARYAVSGDRILPLWKTSLGRMSYPRRLLLRFFPSCDYNVMAKSYRAYVKERGRLVTLREKAARDPKVARLVGCPVIHEGIAVHISPDSDYYRKGEPDVNDNWVTFAKRAEQIASLRARGLKKAYTHFDGWGNHGYDNLHPSPFPPHEQAGGADGMRALGRAVRDAGYLFGIHDQYRDYYYDAPDFSFDEAVMNADGGHPFCSVWYGGRHTFLCAERAVSYVRRNYDEFEKLGVGLDGSYLDVFSVVNLDECFDPAHPMTRQQCAEARRRCLDILTDRGIIPSSEETLDCILPSQVLCHHSPFFTSDLGSGNAEPVGIPIPLFSLVYHDCVVIPWIGGPGGKGGWGIPGCDSAFTWAQLCGCPVYCPIDADADRIAAVEKVCSLAEKLAYTEMISHEFIDGDPRRRRTVFADGTVVEADLDTDVVVVR